MLEEDIERGKNDHLVEIGISLLLLTIMIFYSGIFLFIYTYIRNEPGHPKPFDFYTITEPMYIGFWIIVPFLLYFAPTLFSLPLRNFPVKSKWATFKMNFLFGWTIIGWVNCWGIILDSS